MIYLIVGTVSFRNDYENGADATRGILLNSHQLPVSLTESLLINGSNKNKFKIDSSSPLMGIDFSLAKRRSRFIAPLCPVCALDKSNLIGS